MKKVNEKLNTSAFKNSLGLTVGIPAGRDVKYTLGILSRLKKPKVRVKVIVARWTNTPFQSDDLRSLNLYFSTKQVLSHQRNAPAMRNTIIRNTKSTHILFLDDDTVPDSLILEKALALMSHKPSYIYQGPPYLVANSTSWLARMEGKLYERGFKKYILAGNKVTLLDAKVLLSPTKILKESPFDDSLVFGGGEGRELAKCLMKRKLNLKLTPDLIARHINRDTILSLTLQKLSHGRVRGGR